MSPTLLDLKAGRNFLRDKFLISIATGERRVALTFDDGPNPRNTPRLLDLLDRKKISASFFLVGKYVRHFREVADRIVADGHDIGNHTYHHYPLTLLPSRVIRAELRRTGDLLEEIAGTPVRFVRPPMGWFSRRVLEIFRDMNYCPVLGNVYPQDSNRPGAEVIAHRVVSRMEPGSIVILHDGGWHSRIDRSQTIDAVDRMTDQLGEAGYRFDSLSNLVTRSETDQQD